MNDTPIGIIDSGLGGLSIWQSVRAQLKDESIIYCADHKYLPYSGKRAGVIIGRINNIIAFLIKTYKVKLVIIACNTATVAGIDAYRRLYPDIPIIGVVPVVKTAVHSTKTGHVAILSTPFTANSAYQKRLIDEFAKGKSVYSIGCPSLVTYIEKGMITGSRIRRELTTILAHIHGIPVDVIALGCTHYPFVRSMLQSIVKKKVTILDSGGAVARQTNRILMANDALASHRNPECIFITTGNSVQVGQIATKLIGMPIHFIHQSI